MKNFLVEFFVLINSAAGNAGNSQECQVSQRRIFSEFRFYEYFFVFLITCMVTIKNFLLFFYGIFGFICYFFIQHYLYVSINKFSLLYIQLIYKSDFHKNSVYVYLMGIEVISFDGVS